MMYINNINFMSRFYLICHKNVFLNNQGNSNHSNLLTKLHIRNAL